MVWFGTFNDTNRSFDIEYGAPYHDKTSDPGGKMKQPTTSSPAFGRRGFLQIIAAAGAVGALYHFSLKADRPVAATVRRSRTLMGTQINLTVYGPEREQCENAVNATFSRMEDLVRSLSRHDPGSELSRLNATGNLQQPSEDLCRVLRQADEISRATDGAFDVTVLPLLRLYTEAGKKGILPADDQILFTRRLADYRKVRIHDASIELAEKGMSITLDGIGKGYVVDEGVATLKTLGFTNVYVEAGGDLMAAGSKPGDIPWRIGIRNPRPESSSRLNIVEMSDRAVATSGDYMQPFTPDMRHHHIIDPRTGFSPPGLASATVTAPSVALADGLATAAMVMGPDRSLEVIGSLSECEGLFIGKDLRHYKTEGFIQPA